MIKYHFFYDNNSFVGIKSVNNIIRDYLDEEAIEEIQRIGRKDYKKISVSANTITLKNDVYEISIDNLKRLYRDNIIGYLGDTLPKIETAIKKNQVKKAVGKKISSKKGIYIAACSSLIAVSLLGAFSAKKSPVNEPIKIEVEALEDDDTFENVTGIPVNIQPLINDTNEYDELLNELEEIPTANIQYDYIDVDKQQYAYENYHELVNKFANKWGLSPNIPMSVLTQESGGKETNLMQIQFISWKDMPITGYNYEKGEYQTIVLTDEPEKYINKGYMTISRNDLKNAYTNISIGTLLLEYSIKHMDYHISAGLQAYNFGVTNMDRVLEETVIQTGQSKEDILSDQANTSFTDYTDIVDVGDKDYLSHVVRFNLDDEFYINEMNSDGEVVTHTVKINTTKTK